MGFIDEIKAKAKADNAKEVTAVREIKVRKQKIPENITYTKNKGNDFQNTDTSSGPKTGDESDFRWIFAMAAAVFSGILLFFLFSGKAKCLLKSSLISEADAYHFCFFYNLFIRGYHF